MRKASRTASKRPAAPCANCRALKPKPRPSPTGPMRSRVSSLLAVGGVLPPPLLEVIAEQFARSGGPEPDPRLVKGITTVSAFAIGWAVTEAAGLTPSTTVVHETERQRIRRITRALPPETPDRLVGAAITVCAAEPEPMFSASVAAIIKGCGYELASSRPGSKTTRARQSQP